MARAYYQTYSLWDLFRGRGGRQSTDQGGFIFVEQSGLTNSGEQVNVDNLLSDSTVITCVNAIVQGITQIPIYVRKEREDGIGMDRIKNHPVEKLMKRPNSFQTPTEFKSSIVTAMLTHGNAFIRLVRAGGDINNTSSPVVQLFPLDPSDITIGSNAFGVPTYTHEEYGAIDTDNIVHIRDLNTYTPQGISRLIQAAEIIGAKRAADRLMAETFRNGISLNYVINSNEALDSDKLKNLQEQMKNAFGRTGDRRGGVAFVENGSIDQLKGSTPADVDLRELRAMLINEIAAVLRVPAFMAGGNVDQRYNNVRQYWTAFHRDTLQPIITNIEEAMTLKLLGENEYLHFDVNEILKGDVEITSRVAQGNVSNGIWTPNEARETLGYNRHDEADADQLIKPNSTTNTNLDRDPENATGGADGPQGEDNVEE